MVRSFLLFAVVHACFAQPQEGTKGPTTTPRPKEKHEIFSMEMLLHGAVQLVENHYPEKGDTRTVSERITETCVPETLLGPFRTGVESAAESIQEKSKSSMQTALKTLANALIDFFDGTSCGDVAAIKRLRKQADQLRSWMSKPTLFSQVKYEPLKHLTVRGMDIWNELNMFFITWKKKLGPVNLGLHLFMLLEQLDDEAKTTQPPSGEDDDEDEGGYEGIKMPQMPEEHRHQAEL